MPWQASWDSCGHIMTSLPDVSSCFKIVCMECLLGAGPTPLWIGHWAVVWGVGRHGAGLCLYVCPFCRVLVGVCVCVCDELR